MPRLIKSDQAILALIRIFGSEEASNVQYTDDSPDATPEIDVCATCFKGFFKAEEKVKDHPPYTKKDRCVMCGKTLEDE